jgi:hypothetical protein
MISGNKNCLNNRFLLIIHSIRCEFSHTIGFHFKLIPELATWTRPGYSAMTFSSSGARGESKKRDKNNNYYLKKHS